MTIDASRLGDQLDAASGYQRPTIDGDRITGHGVVELRGADGELKQSVPFTNLITQVGEQMYGERGGGTSSPPAAPTGMALGTGTTAVAKTGAGAALVTGLAGSAAALGSTPTSSIPGTVRRITYTQTWAAGSATSNGIAEVVLQNGTATTVPTNAATTNVVARALLSPTVNKGASDSLTITWNHDIGT